MAYFAGGRGTMKMDPGNNVAVELLAPARDKQSAVLAVDFGADAVYMGARLFGARAAASNAAEDIAAAAEYAHRYHARLYVTLNTLLRDDEIARAREVGREVLAAGADALIVQDMSWLRMGLGEVEFHASTQTYNATPEKVEFLARSGFSRVILERGLSLEQIAAIRAATDVQLECFVYGAICVGGGGRCYLSRSMGPRSGNRGVCAQPCRLEYDLLDGRGRPVVTGRHLLSVRDLDLTDRIGVLLDAGVTSFKIEGRLKNVNYVRNSVALLRRALDGELSARPALRKASAGVSVPAGARMSEYAAAGVSTYDFTPAQAAGFSRGATRYMLDGPAGGVADLDSPKSVGAFVGCAVDVGRERFRLDSGRKLTAGDGICFLSAGRLVGTRINTADPQGAWPDSMHGIKEGTRIYRNYDKSHNDALEASRVRRVIPVKVRAMVSENSLCVQAQDARGYVAEVSLEGDFPAATDPARMLGTIEDSVRRSGDTDFVVTQVEVTADGKVPFISRSVLNGLRRECLKRLSRIQLEGRPQSAPRPEDLSYPCPEPNLGPEWNVTNGLAEQFYRQHGVRRISRGYDADKVRFGTQVMRTPYCIRREIGRCLKDRSAPRSDLFLVHGDYRYRLEFDCAACMMSLIYEPLKPSTK